MSNNINTLTQLSLITGNIWLNGTSSPVGTVTANVGDWFLNTTNFNIYRYGVNGWELVGNIKGDEFLVNEWRKEAFEQTSLTTFQTYFTQTFTLGTALSVAFEVNYHWAHTRNDRNHQVDFLVDGVQQLNPVISIEPAEKSEGGLGTQTQRFTESFKTPKLNLAAGSHSFTLRYRTSNNDGLSSMYYASVQLYRSKLA